MAGSNMGADDLIKSLRAGMVIPAHPLALTAQRRLDERRQRGLTRYYIESGSGGLAIGVHTTQFAIRHNDVGLYKPVLELAAETAREYAAVPILIAGVLGDTRQAISEATLARDLGYDAVLLSLAGLGDHSIDQLISHCHQVGEILPLMGFYLQATVGGIPLPYTFWRRFAEIPAVVGIKIAPFNRYQTLDVIRGVADSGRASQIALYTGNDDTIISDLLLPFDLGKPKPPLRITGGLLGHWAVWTHATVRIFERIRGVVTLGSAVPQDILRLGWQITDANSAFFDAANNYRGCIAGLHEVLRRQGLLEGIWCLDASETLSPGQAEDIDRVYSAYPHLNDDAFIAEHLHRWLH
jgi:dihydrodipicolinate synthase/N-acetylneuraminate lyase